MAAGFKTRRKTHASTMHRQPLHGPQQEKISPQAQTFWKQWTEAAFPDLDSHPYFLPPVYFNRVPMTRQSTGGQEVLVLHKAPSVGGQDGPSTPGQDGPSNQLLTIPCAGDKNGQPSSVQDSNVRDDATMQRVLFCLKKMSEKNGEVLVGLSQLQFGQYMGQHCYMAAAAHLSVDYSLPTALSKHKQGDFDVLLIHRQYGIVVCEVKAFGDTVDKLNMSQQDIDKKIRIRLRKAVLQLDKAETMLSHLVSDVTPGLRITKTIVVPNLTARQVEQAISGDKKLLQKLDRCLGTPADPANTADITGLFLCSDQLSDPKTPWDVSSDVLRELGNWWQRRVAVSGPDSHMSFDHYKKLVARFCGPATTVTVPCTSPPRLRIETLGQAVSLTGECYAAQITLFPEQLHLVNTAHPRVFVAGPPGTGKTVVLLLKATGWLRSGNDVHIVSTWCGSRAACIILYHLLLEIVYTQLTSVVSPGQPHLLQYDFNNGKDIEKATNDLKNEVWKESLYVIADEINQERSNDFQTFFDKLLTQVPRLHFWAASCFHGYAHAGWRVECLTKPLRSPPAVLREISNYHLAQAYSKRGVVPNCTDGPPVRRLYHRGQGHSADWPQDCAKCGKEVALLLRNLHVPENSTTSKTVTTINSSTTPPYLQWRDMLVLCRYDVSDKRGVMTGMREAGIPVRVMNDDDIEDVATAHSDVVWVADGDRVHGLERKVVVWLESGSDGIKARFLSISRCASQLLIVSSGQKPPEHEYQKIRKVSMQFHQDTGVMG